MKLTTFSDYTLRVLMFLALNRDRLATIPEIAAAYGISETVSYTHLDVYKRQPFGRQKAATLLI